METISINTDANASYDFEGSPKINFLSQTIELANGEVITRYMKFDCRKEYNQCSNYETRKQWESAIKRAKKQFAQFN
jgi:hypothetical protein